MSLLGRLPLITLGVALLVFTLTLFLTVTSGVGLAQPINLILIALLALGSGLLFSALDPNNERAALFLWFCAGAWSAAGYLDFQTLGLLDLLVAGLAAGSAFVVEREQRAFSASGPIVFIVTSVGTIILAKILVP